MGSTSRKRKVSKPTFVPSWDPDLKRWTAAYARRNLRKCRDPAFDVDDLIQEGYLVFERVRRKYIDVVSDAPHFFALYATSYTREFYDHMVTGNQNRSLLDTNVDLYLAEWLSDNGENAAFTRLLIDAPIELRMVLGLYDDPNSLAELRKPYRQAVGAYRSPRGQVRESFNRRLCRVLGIPVTDLVGPIKEALLTRT